MKYLLDTHILIWMIFSPEKLSKEVKNILADDTNIISVSPISFWEISLKFSIGKLQLNNVLPNELVAICKSMNLDTIPLTNNDTSTFYKLKVFFHKDPFDRMLIWQAMQNNLIFISDDKFVKMYSSEGLRVMW